MKKIIVSLCAVTLVFSCGNGNNKQHSEQSVASQQTETKSEVKPAAPELAEIVPGYEFFIQDSECAPVTFTFKEVKKKKLADGTFNLVLKVLIKNETATDLMVSDIGWRLTDSDMVEVEESGVWDSTFGCFAPGMFFFTIVEAGYGKVEEVGYHVSAGRYILNVLRNKKGYITIE